MVSKMYAENSLLKLVTLVLIHYHSTIEENRLIIHKVYGQYANMILFKKGTIKHFII